MLLYALIGVFALHEIIDHLQHARSPIVSNYQVFDTRTTPTKINTKQGHFGFGLKDQETQTFFDLLGNDGTEVIGGRFGTFEAFTLTEDGRPGDKLELEYCSESNFDEGTDLSGYENLVCLKNTDQISLNPGKSSILIKMKDCDSALIENCASLSNRQRFFD